jgi:hypothetical protein
MASDFIARAWGRRKIRMPATGYRIVIGVGLFDFGFQILDFGFKVFFPNQRIEESEFHHPSFPNCRFLTPALINRNFPYILYI